MTVFNTFNYFPQIRLSNDKCIICLDQLQKKYTKLCQTCNVYIHYKCYERYIQTINNNEEKKCFVCNKKNSLSTKLEKYKISQKNNNKHEVININIENVYVNNYSHRCNVLINITKIIVFLSIYICLYICCYILGLKVLTDNHDIIFIYFKNQNLSFYIYFVHILIYPLFGLILLCIITCVCICVIGKFVS